tara:strand:+ start:67 stop:615 length:549 start_codon:yes stop_codon:yes gene_type:complete
MPKQLNMKPTKTVEKRNDPLYNKSMLEMSVLLLPSQIGANGKTKENIRDTIEHYIGGKCIIEGYVKPNSIQIQQYTNGIVKLDKVEFLVVFECLVCNPVEGMWLNDCKVKSVTKAGIHANKYDEQNNLPVTVFIIRDHFVDNPRFLKIKEEDIIDVKVLGQRFELNNQCIEVIGEIVGDKSN